MEELFTKLNTSLTQSEFVANFLEKWNAFIELDDVVMLK